MMYLGMNIGISRIPHQSLINSEESKYRIPIQKINGGPSIEKINAGLRQIPTHLRGASSMRKSITVVTDRGFMNSCLFFEGKKHFPPTWRETGRIMKNLGNK